MMETPSTLRGTAPSEMAGQPPTTGTPLTTKKSSSPTTGVPSIKYLVAILVN
jgi:hypothetical protein